MYSMSREFEYQNQILLASNQSQLLLCDWEFCDSIVPSCIFLFYQCHRLLLIILMYVSMYDVEVEHRNVTLLR